MATFNDILARTERRVSRKPRCSEAKVTFGTTDGRTRPVEISGRLADAGDDAALLAATLQSLTFTSKRTGDDQTSASVSRMYKDDDGHEVARSFAEAVGVDWPADCDRARTTEIVSLVKGSEDAPGMTLTEAIDYTSAESIAKREAQAKTAAKTAVTVKIGDADKK